MGKVVYNACFGGFSLSEAALLRYAELKGIQLYPDTSGFVGGVVLWLSPPTGDPVEDNKRESLWYWEIERDDLALIQVVEELGSEANGHYADLQIAEIPAGLAWRIDKYNGQESVMTVNDYEWKIARE